MDRPKADSVLVFSGLDPSGAAGIAADIETINQFGLTPLPIITLLTAQNTQKVESLEVTKNDLLEHQFKLIDEDIHFNTVKIGLLGSSSQIIAISNLIKNRKQLNIVLDPILISGTNENLSSIEIMEAMKAHLFPLCLVLTPNLEELNALAPGLDEQAAVASLNCPWILVTTSDSSEAEIEHRLYHEAKLIQKFIYDKLPHKFHGSGCTLSSAISALIASGDDVDVACNKALQYTYQCLLNAKKLGKMQFHPNRTSSKLI